MNCFSDLSTIYLCLFGFVLKKKKKICECDLLFFFSKVQSQKIAFTKNVTLHDSTMSVSSAFSGHSSRVSIKCSGCKEQIPSAQKRAHDKACVARERERVVCDRCGKTVMRSSFGGHLVSKSCLDVWWADQRAHSSSRDDEPNRQQEHEHEQEQEQGDEDALQNMNVQIVAMRRQVEKAARQKRPIFVLQNSERN
jgi:hypothetical protein